MRKTVQYVERGPRLVRVGRGMPRGRTVGTWWAGYFRQLAAKRLREAAQLRACAASAPRCSGDARTGWRHAVAGPHGCRLRDLEDARECVGAAGYFARRAIEEEAAVRV